MVKFWDDVKALSPRNAQRQQRLELMNAWRNAIAHQDFKSPHALKTLNGRSSITLPTVRWFRAACNGLAAAFDAVGLAHVKAVVGPSAGW